MQIITGNRSETTKIQPSNTANTKIQPITKTHSRQIISNVGLVRNDASRTSLKRLVFIKELISRQLPKMPKYYITKLLFDHKHQCLYLQSEGKIIGAACFRCFKEKEFVQLVFLAVSQGYRECGLGSKIMDNLKQQLQNRQKALLLTYADQTAVGFFKKQAFYFTVEDATKQWTEYIKPYQGGRLMQCQVDKNFNYGRFRNIIKMQQEQLLNKVKQIYSSQAKYQLKQLDNILERNQSKNKEKGRQNATKGIKHNQEEYQVDYEIDLDVLPGVLDNRWSKQKEQELQAQNKLTRMLQQLSALQYIFKIPSLRMISDIEYPEGFKHQLTFSMVQKKAIHSIYESSQELTKDIRTLMNEWKRFCSEDEMKLMSELQKKIEAVLELLVSGKLDLKNDRKSKQAKSKLTKPVTKI